MEAASYSGSWLPAGIRKRTIFHQRTAIRPGGKHHSFGRSWRINAQRPVGPVKVEFARKRDLCPFAHVTMRWLRYVYLHMPQFRCTQPLRRPHKQNRTMISSRNVAHEVIAARCSRMRFTLSDHDPATASLPIVETGHSLMRSGNH